MREQIAEHAVFERVEFDDTKKVFTAPRDKRTQDYITGRFG